MLVEHFLFHRTNAYLIVIVENNILNMNNICLTDEKYHRENIYKLFSLSEMF